MKKPNFLSCNWLLLSWLQISSKMASSITATYDTTPSHLHLLPPQFHPTLHPSHLTMAIMPNPISCLRCTNYCLQCSVDTFVPPPCWSKIVLLCHQCDSATLDCFLFPPSSDSSTLEAMYKKCIFLNATNSQCTRCSKGHLSCCFKMFAAYKDFH
jgi:hypothetical protein